MVWACIDPAELGWSAGELAAAYAISERVAATAVVVVHGGKIVAAWGDLTVKVNVRSVRKSLLSAVYGIGIAEGRINLRLSLADLGIDEEAGLTAMERRATVRDLLMARSGVYLPAAYETATMKSARPPRGSHAPGTFWYYNNWDFNVLGAIYERLMGETVFDGLHRCVAGRIGMEDFSVSDGRFVLEPCSRHPAYPMTLSARDLARFGLLFLHRGSWGGCEIVPPDWTDESTSRWSEAIGGLDYGYMWWVVTDRTPRARAIGPGSFMALGHGGQGVFVSRGHDLVVVQLVTARPGQERGNENQCASMIAKIIAAMPSGQV